jgi:NADH/NAD ratio-sensing transcriptional regulator Rex
MWYTEKCLKDREEKFMDDKTISVQTLRRLPVYLHYLNSIKNSQKNISATAISGAFGLNDVQVRKDLGAVSGSGRPKTGYVVKELIEQIEQYLGCKSETKTVLIGAGNLGKALLSYDGFHDFGLNIIAAFDNMKMYVDQLLMTSLFCRFMIWKPYAVIKIFSSELLPCLFPARRKYVIS